MTVAALIEQVARLTDTNLRAPDSRIEHDLVQLRLEIFARQRLGRHPGPPLPRTPAAPLPGYELPVVRAESLTTETLRHSIAQRGALLVRSLLHEEHIAVLRAAIDATLDAQDLCDAAGWPVDHDQPWYVPQDIIPRASRDFVRADGCVLAVESPRGLTQLLSILHAVGVVELTSRFFGERPVLSPQKTTFRRAAPGPDDRRGWHQDGHFLGAEIRVLISGSRSPMPGWTPRASSSSRRGCIAS